MDPMEIMVKAIADSFPLFAGTLNRNTTAVDVPGWDSFGHIQLIFALEDLIGMPLNVAQTLSCNNVGELCDLLREKIQ